MIQEVSFMYIISYRCKQENRQQLFLPSFKYSSKKFSNKIIQQFESIVDDDDGGISNISDLGSPDPQSKEV